MEVIVRKLFKTLIAVTGLTMTTFVVRFAAIAFPVYSNIITGCYITAVLLLSITIFANYYLVKMQLEKKAIKNLLKITNSINAMVILWDADFRYVEVNDEITKTLGYTSEDFKNTDMLRKILPNDAFENNIQVMIDNRDNEFVCITKGGSRVCTIWNTSVVNKIKKKNKDSYIMMSIGMNMTETVKMKEELIRYARDLTESENKYSLTMELSEIGLILKEPHARNFYISDQLKSMMGIKSNYISNSMMRARIHPNDLPVYDSLATVLSGCINVDSSEIRSIDFRAVSADGKYRWYQFRYKATPNSKRRLARIGGSVIDITKDKEKDETIERMAYIDDVTGIFNRNKFMQIGQETFQSCKGLDYTYWVIVFDIDNFHTINDTCGYAYGNKLLSEFAGIIKDTISSCGFASRIGGDNFAIILRDNGEDDLPVRVIRDIQNSLSELCNDFLKTQTLTCSAGYCKMTDGGNDFAKVLDHAEFSLNLSDGTRSTILRYDHSLHEKFIALATIEYDLAKAIDNNELTLYYQPKINLADGKLIGVEALVRWIKQDGTLVPPNQFIPIAEHSLLITRISSFVLKEACRQNKEWQDKGFDPITVSINLTAVDFYQTDIKEIISEVLNELRLEAQWLDVELTESLALKDINHAIDQMNKIKELGVKLSMDDFGTGYSSLSYIQILPITLLKLDRSFIMRLEEDEVSREIVSAVIRIAKSKKIEIVAEGIETIGQADILKKSGCEYAQGYLFGRPMPAKKFEEFMLKRQTVPVIVET